MGYPNCITLYYSELLLNETHLDGIFNTTFSANIDWSFWVNGIFFLLIASVGILGSGATIGILSIRHLRAKINIYFIGLAGWDILALVLYISLIALPSIADGSNAAEGPMVYIYLIFYPICYVCRTAAIWTLLIAIIERYLALAHPLIHRKHYTPKLVKRCLFGTGMCALVFTLPKFFELTVKYCHENSTVGSQTTGESSLVPSIAETALRKNYYYLMAYIVVLDAVFVSIGPFLVQAVLTIKLGLRLGTRDATIRASRGIIASPGTNAPSITGVGKLRREPTTSIASSSTQNNNVMRTKYETKESPGKRQTQSRNNVFYSSLTSSVTFHRPSQFGAVSTSSLTAPVTCATAELNLAASSTNSSREEKQCEKTRIQIQRNRIDKEIRPSNPGQSTPLLSSGDGKGRYCPETGKNRQKHSIANETKDGACSRSREIEASTSGVSQEITTGSGTATFVTGNGNVKQSRQPKEHGMSRLFVAVSIKSLVCSLLPLITNIVEVVLKIRGLHTATHSDSFTTLVALSNVMVTVNSSVNFFVLLVFAQTFRQQCLRLLCCKTSQ